MVGLGESQTNFFSLRVDFNFEMTLRDVKFTVAKL